MVIHDLSREQILDYVLRPSDRPRFVCNVNAHGLHLALRDAEFCRILNEADVCFCDGFGVKFLSRLLGYGTISHRVTPPDLIEELFLRLRRNGRHAFLLGDDPGVAARYAGQVNGRCPGVVAGWEDGFFHVRPGGEAALLARLAAVGAAVVPVGMGMPLQEKWAERHRGELPPAAYMMVGALFSWMSGTRRRGPQWAVDNGLEWFFRLLFEPQRVWRRYVVGLPAVTLRLLCHRLRCGPGM